MGLFRKVAAGTFQPDNLRKSVSLLVTDAVVEARVKTNQPRHREIATRGVVREFTRYARMRMLKMINRIAWDDVGKSLLITLTYPDQFHTLDYSDRSMHRAWFHRELEKELGREVSVIWRIEWLPRKSGPRQGFIHPHFHLIVLGVNYVHHQTVRKIWRRVLKVEGPLATDVRQIKGVEGAVRYVCKYLSKPLSLDIGAYRNIGAVSGRHWGILRPSKIPWCNDLVRTMLGDSEWEQLILEYLSINPKYGEFGLVGFVFFGKMFAKRIAEKYGYRVDMGPGFGDNEYTK